LEGPAKARPLMAAPQPLRPGRVARPLWRTACWPTGAGGCIAEVGHRRGDLSVAGARPPASATKRYRRARPVWPSSRKLIKPPSAADGSRVVGIGRGGDDLFQGDRTGAPLPATPSPNCVVGQKANEFGLMPPPRNIRQQGPAAWLPGSAIRATIFGGLVGSARDHSDAFAIWHAPSADRASTGTAGGSYITVPKAS